MRFLGMLAALAVILRRCRGRRRRRQAHPVLLRRPLISTCRWACTCPRPTRPPPTCRRRSSPRRALATAKYANDLGAAKADGYSILTQQIAGMGYHFINPAVKGFDVRKPPILVYEKHGERWQLGALEWVFPKTPATPPLKGATYGSFPAACHYKDGTFVPEPSQDPARRRARSRGRRSTSGTRPS